MKYILSVLLLGLSFTINSQNTLNGKVTDENDEPMFGVEIYIAKINGGTSTDENGHYSFQNLPKGTLKVVFSYVGFISVSILLDIDNTPKTLNIVLKESVYKMDEIIVSTPFNKLQSENVMKVEHKSIEQLKKQGAATLIEGLTNIAGVSQVSTGPSIGKPVIRGLTGNRVLVYAQGVRLENQQFGDEHGLGLNEEGIESVEVIKGPASLLYGSDALGGVLYFNPEKFAVSNTIESGFGQKYFTNTKGYNSTFNFKASAEKFKFLTRASYSSHIDYKIPNGTRITNTRFNEYDLKTGIKYSFKNFTSTLRYNYNLLKLGINEGEINMQSTHRNPDFPKQKVHNHILSLHNHILFDKSSFDAELGYLFNDRSEFENSSIPSLRMLLKTINYTFKYNLPQIGNVEAIFGLQGMHQTNTNKANEILIPDAIINDIGGFTTVNYQWKNNTVQGGARFDTRSINTEQIDTVNISDVRQALSKSYRSFNASAGYKNDMSNRSVLRINLASGFRAPNLAELTSNGVHEGTNRFEIGNTELKNEQNYQTDLAYEYNGDHMEFFLNGFYNAINNYIFLSPNGEEIESTDVFNYVQDNAKLYGGEIGFHLHPHPLDWLHFESSFEVVIGKQKNGHYLPLIPANKISNTIRVNFNVENWLENGYAYLKLNSFFEQNKVSQFETSTAGYNVLNFGFGSNIDFNKSKFNISLNINNIFNTTYIAHLSRLKNDNIENIGRTVAFGLKFNI
jgi:iron complex outermembrane receptor protein